MIRTRSSRLVSVVVATLLGVALLPGLAAAADTRTLWIGAPDLSIDADGNGIPDNSGMLFPTPVTVPAAPPAPAHLTLFEVEVLSTDNQNLAHTVLTITIPVYLGLSLFSYDDTTNCDDAGQVITCDYGSLEAGGSRSVAVLVEVASTFVVAGQPSPLFTADVITNNENGANQQLFTATSGPWAGSSEPGFSVGAFSDNALTTFVPAGLVQQLATTGLGTTGAGMLSSLVRFTAGGNETVAISEGTSVALVYPCPSGLTCQEEASEVITGSGVFDDSPYFTWRLTALVPKQYALSQGFVAHYPTQATSPDWILPFKAKSSYCGSLEITANGHCIKFATLSKPVNGFSTLVVEVVMDEQGGMRF